MFQGLFTPKQNQQQQAPQNQGQGQQGQQGQNQQGQGQGQGQGQNTIQGPGTMPGSGGHPDNQNAQNPLDAYSKLWENSSGANPSGPPVFNLDPTALNNAASGIKFMDGIPQELTQRALSGDSQAMMDMMNHVAQSVYKHSLNHSSMLTDKFVGAYSAYDQKNMAPKVRNQLVGQELSKIPNYSHPAVKAQVDMIAEQMQRQNPDASPTEVADHVRQYFKASMMAMGLVDPNNGQQADPSKAQGQVDWMKWVQS